MNAKKNLNKTEATKKLDVSTPKENEVKANSIQSNEKPINEVKKVPRFNVSEKSKVKSRKQRIQELRVKLRRENQLTVPEGYYEEGYVYYYASSQKAVRLFQVKSLGYSKALNKDGEPYEVHGGSAENSEYNLILMKTKKENKALIDEAKGLDVIQVLEEIMPEGVKKEHLYTKKGMGDLNSVKGAFNIKQL